MVHASEISQTGEMDEARGLVMMDIGVAVTTMTYLEVARPWHISIRRCLAIHGLSLGRRGEIIAG